MSARLQETGRNQSDLLAIDEDHLKSGCEMYITCGGDETRGESFSVYARCCWGFETQIWHSTLNTCNFDHMHCTDLSGHVPEIQAEVEVVKIKNPDFSCWAWSTPWGLVLSLKSFCRNPVLSWAIRYSVFQKVKFT